MPQQPMYPGQANSPQTELAANIDDSQTTIPLLDASVLPEGPNLVVIGSGENAETVKYESINGNDLENCTRGFQGVAKAWSAGQKVARYFTAYDYDALRKNLIAHLAETVQQADETVTVGSGGDFNTLNEALEYFSLKTHIFVSGGLTANIEILSGTTITESMHVRRKDLGWIWISSENDETVNVDVSSDFIVADFNATGPIIDCLFDMGNTGGSGIRVWFNSRVTVRPDAGVINAGGIGLDVNNGGFVDCNSADFSGASSHGIYAVNGSWVNARGVVAENCGASGLRANNASWIAARECTVNGAGEHGAHARNGSFISVQDSFLNDATEIGVFADRGARIYAQGAEARNAGGDAGISVFSGSQVEAGAADVSGATGRGIQCLVGSWANANNINAASTGQDGIVVGSGSTINARGATGSLSQTANSITSDGIIFQ